MTMSVKYFLLPVISLNESNGFSALSDSYLATAMEVDKTIIMTRVESFFASYGPEFADLSQFCAFFL